MFPLSPQPPVVLDRSLATFTSLSIRSPQDLRPGNPDRQFWKEWISYIAMYGFYCTSEEYQHDQCWGWTILRTSYDDDEAFNQAVAAIQRLALVRLEDEHRDSRTRGRPDNDTVEASKEKITQYWDRLGWVSGSWATMVRHAQDAMPGEPLTPDFVISHELVRRYHMTIIQDRQTLDGVDVAKAWDYAHALNLEEREPGARSALFIYLDQESIDQLASAPGQQNLAAMDPRTRSKTAWEYWVKAVWIECETTEDGKSTDRMMGIPLGGRRIRLYDIFETFMVLCTRSLDEMDIEGRGRERFDRGRLGGPEGEWDLCGEESWEYEREPWLRDLYGERVHGGKFALMSACPLD